MKTGILTFVGTQSHGACLQAYALKTAVEKLGTDVEVINYHCDKIDEVKTSKLPSNAKGLKKRVGALVKYPIFKKRWDKFEAFEKEYLKLGKRVTRDEIPTAYDRIIVGSDQIWNGDITGDDYTYFLDNIAESSRKLSYAASLGKDSFSPETEQKCLDLVKDFAVVNVRENSLRQYLDEKLDKEISCVIDPTLIVDPSVWYKMAGDKPMIGGDYLFVHAPTDNDETWAAIYKLAEKKGLQIIYQSNGIGFKKGRKCLFSVSPIEYMNYIKFAKFVVTGSFHTLSFSLIFNRQFLCTGSMVKGRNSRLSNLLETAGCEDRLLSKKTAEDAPVIAYDDVNGKIKAAAELSRKKLAEMLK